MELARKLRDNFNFPLDFFLFGRILLYIAVLPVPLKFLTLPRLMKFVSWHAGGFAGFSSTEEYVGKIVRYTDYLLSKNFWVYRKTCLKRSLVLYHFLRPALRGLAICFGVRTKGDSAGNKREGLDGHAWLTCSGEVFLEENPDLIKKYIVTYRFPENPSSEKTSGEDFINLSNENKVLLYCSRTRMPEEKAPEFTNLLSGSLNWKFISEAALSHNVRELLYRNLKSSSCQDSIPDDVMEDLKRSYHETIARNMYIYSELRTILDALRRAGTEAIALKGAALAGFVYPDIGLRPMADIDLLVREEELEVADRVMIAMGYSPVHSTRSHQWHRDNHFHLPPYRHPQKPFVVEIHWHFTTGSQASDIRKWWQRSLGRNLSGSRILIPSAEDMLIHLTVHLFNHGYDNGFVLRGLCDIFETLRYYAAEIDWKLLEDEIREQGMERQVHSILHLARKYYAPRNISFIPINLDHADQHFLHVLESSLFVDGVDTPINPHLLKSMMIDNFSKKIRYLMTRVFPSRQQMAERYPSSSFPAMVLLYYIFRPLNLLSRYGKSAARIYRTGRDGRDSGEL